MDVGCQRWKHSGNSFSQTVPKCIALYSFVSCQYHQAKDCSLGDARHPYTIASLGERKLWISTTCYLVGIGSLNSERSDWQMEPGSYCIILSWIFVINQNYDMEVCGDHSGGAKSANRINELSKRAVVEWMHVAFSSVEFCDIIPLDRLQYNTAIEIWARREEMDSCFFQRYYQEMNVID